MAKEQFFNAASKPIVDLVDRAGDLAGFGRGQAFEDFLTLLRCELAGKTMEDEYLATVAKGYDKGKVGSRGIDTMVQAGGRLIAEMVNTDADILGDIFTGAITYGERGQFFTPDSVCDLMAALMSPGNTEEGADVSAGAPPRTINDPACGSGRFLLSMAKDNPNAEFTGQDVDHRCTQMAAVNMGLHGLRGWAVWQNTLTLECHRVYRIGLFFNGASRGVIREVPVAQSPFNHASVPIAAKPTQATPEAPVADHSNGQAGDITSSGDASQMSGPSSQLDLF
ncbi:N-6 DNA Methylase [Rubripirellula lacrimiformis]|uniref:site-specific DNA-methyltransferase (adenine-specific) n=1 Tax=Rubripirellula lacrimiformis TaxID=1930273 RepID=A0A517NK91_9BACT|nr:N-6 DNA methylase [Rubripirellula lacrimiformis]QDT07453.1 N-6 DNA Methylase [Rubripirellula lacrimiformis]